MATSDNVAELYDIKRQILVHEANKWVGIQETSNNKGAEVEMFQKAVDGKAQGEPWCCCFIQFCLNQVDSEIDKAVKIIHDRSWIYKTELCAAVWAKTPIEARIRDPEPGCLVVWGYELNGKPTGKGHIGIVERIGENTLYTIEGNTGPSSNEIKREGDGVYRKTRPRHSGIGNMKLVGFLRCWPNKEFDLTIH